jgi:hypothetical protein
MKYVRAKPGYWYLYTANGFLYFISDAAKLNRKQRMKSLRRSRSVVRRLGYKFLKV